MSEKVAIPVGEQDKVSDSGSPLKDFTVTETMETPQLSPKQEQIAIETAKSIAAPPSAAPGPISVEPIGDYYDQGESIVEVTVGTPSGGASPSEAKEVDTQASTDAVDSSEQLEGTEETPKGSQPSPNTSSAAFRVSADECPGVADGFCKRKTLAAKWQPKHKRCEKCGVALTKTGTHRKRRNDVGRERDTYNRS